MKQTRAQCRMSSKCCFEDCGYAVDVKPRARMAVPSVALFAVYLFVMLPVTLEAFRMHCTALHVFQLHE